jgi:serine phosphatase RsbU (regulator of sigma subunit)
MMGPDGAAHRMPERLRADLEAAHGGTMALYVMDLDGGCLRLLAGDEARVPGAIPTRIGIGPEIPPESYEALAAALRGAVPGCGWAPLALADRALGAVVRVEGDAPGLDVAAADAAVALEIAGGYTDVAHAARRHRHPQAAAEMQQNLLPPRIARVRGGRLAGGVLPGYDVAGDFIDHADNPDGVWLAVADAVGKETAAGALAAVAIGALRASRRSGEGLGEAVRAMSDAVASGGQRPPAFVTAVVAFWQPATGRLRWVTSGHPRPLVLRAGGGLETLGGGVSRPLGIEDGDVAAAEGRLGPGDRLLLYSDGLVEQPDRRTGEPLGLDTLHDVLRASAGETCAQLVRRLQNMVLDASGGRLRDDVSLLAVDADLSSFPARHDVEPGRTTTAQAVPDEGGTTVSTEDRIAERGHIGPEGYSESTTLPSMDRLEGMEVRDADGDKVGRVEDSYTDTGGTYLRYIAVSTGWFGTKHHVIPVDDVFVEEDYLVVPYDKDRLRDAPTFERDENVTRSHEERVYGYYGRPGYWDAIRARQTTPAPTPEIAEAEAEDAVRRGEDPSRVAVKRWGV